MMRRTEFHLLTLVVILLGVTACRAGGQQEQGSSPEPPGGGLPAALLAGSYEVIGRYPDSDELYSGTIEITVSDQGPESLSITRTIDGVSTRGTGAMETALAGEAQVLRVRFQDRDRALEATYLLAVDLDNYARLTGFVYLAADGTRLPGIEALFADHYRDRSTDP